MDPFIALVGPASTLLLVTGLALRRILRESGRAMGVVLSVACNEAGERGHRPVTIAHVALALVCHPDVADALEERGVVLQDLYADVERLLAPRRETPVVIQANDGDAMLNHMIRRIAPAGVLGPPRRVLDDVLTSGPDELRTAFARHGITAERWRSRVVGAGSDVRSSAKPDASGPYRTAPGATRNMDVVLWNDTKTSVAFVVEILRGTFGLLEPFATRTMLAVDRHGCDVAGTYDEPEAQRLAEAAMRLARARGFPLKITVEPTGKRQTRRRRFFPWPVPSA